MAKYTISDIFLGDFPVTQSYGARPEYYKQFGLAGHEGVDWGTPDGTPVIAPFDGTILRDTQGDKDYGNFTVIWDSKQHCAVWYCHLQDVTTQLNQQVKKGDLVGHTNNTGNSSGPHLHVNFVETDESGNRLNKNNGYQGFLNIMDANLVEWKLASSVIIDTMPSYLTGLFQEQGLDINNESQVRAFFQKAIDYPSTKADLDNANTANKVQADQINSLHDDIKKEESTNNQLSLQVQDLEKKLRDIPTSPPNVSKTASNTSVWQILQLLFKKYFH